MHIFSKFDFETAARESSPGASAIQGYDLEKRVASRRVV
jgi:hypothetical protein